MGSRVLVVRSSPIPLRVVLSMINFVPFKGATVKLKGNGANVKDIDAYMDDQRIVVQAELEPEDIIEIAMSRRIQLSVLGQAFPPARLDPVIHGTKERATVFGDDPALSLCLIIDWLRKLKEIAEGGVEKKAPIESKSLVEAIDKLLLALNVKELPK